MSRKIGYARISTHEQNLDLQVNALSAAGCEHLFTDQGVSGACVNRPSLDKALLTLMSGDILVTWKLDRLGRSLAHLIQLINDLDQRGIGFQSISECIDTTTAGGRLYFHLMGALAEFERALISERTKAGLEAARKRGAIIGRPLKLTTEQIVYARKMLESENKTITNVAALLDVAPLTLSRALKRTNAKEYVPDLAEIAGSQE